MSTYPIEFKQLEEENEKLQTEIEGLKKEVEKRKGSAGVLQQIADKLKSLTGEQNVWKAIEELEQPWIPISERLPEEKDYYLVCDGEWYGRMFFDGKWCFGNKDKYPYQEHITHWKPIILPEQILKKGDE